jgi:nitrite reductase/ring-hydroxylating ferredoxin subunit
VVCFLDQCAHQPVKLSEFGEIRSRVLVCHAHGGGFDLARGGKVLCGPPKEPLKGFKCREENGEVTVIID